MRKILAHSPIISGTLHFINTCCQTIYALVGFLHVAAIRSLSTVVGLDGESVLLLQLTVQFILGPDHTLPGGLIQHHCLERHVLPVNPEAADLPCKRHTCV